MDEEGLASAASFAGYVETATRALRRFLNDPGADPSQLYSDPLERAVADIIRCDLVGLGSQDPMMAVRGLDIVARLHYTRYHASPLRPAPYLWSAVRLYRMLKAAPPGLVQLPEDIALVLEVLAVDNPATVPGLDNAAEMSNTAILLSQYAMVEHDPTALLRAEAMARRALDASTPQDPDKAAYICNLIGIVARRWELTDTGSAEELQALIALAEDRALQTDPRLPDLQANAGAACYTLAVRTQNVTLLERCIELIDHAVAAKPDDSPDKANYLQSLGRAELIRWAWGDQSGTLANAVAYLERAVALTIGGDPEAANRHVWLATAQLAGDHADLAGAAQNLSAADALDCVPGVQVNAQLLGEAWLLLWNSRSDDNTALDRAISLLKRPEPSLPQPAPRHDRDSLATALWRRWEGTQDLASLDEVIARLTRRADAPDTPPLLLNLLARALRARWERTGDSIALQHAISCLTTAVSRSPTDDPATSMYLNNLSAMWLRLHEATGNLAALENAVHHSEQALRSCPSEDQGRPMYANNAALAVLELSVVTESDTALSLAVQMAQTAAAITPHDHPDWPSHLVNFGAALAYAATRTGDMTILDDAIEAFNSAIQVTPPSHPAYSTVLLNLGETLLISGRERASSETIARGRDLIRRSAGLAHLRPERSVRAARSWGDTAAEAGDWPTAATALRSAVERLAELPAHRLDRLDHERILIRLAGLATDAAAACCTVGDDRGAIESLELVSCA